MAVALITGCSSGIGKYTPLDTTARRAHLSVHLGLFEDVSECSGRLFYRRELSRRARQKAQSKQAVAEHEGEVRGEAVGENSRRGRITGEEQQPRSLTGPQVGNSDRQCGRKKYQR